MKYLLSILTTKCWKITLFNALINEKRVIDEVEGTTRDSIDSIIKYNNKYYRFIDTWFKETGPEKRPDFYSKIRTLRSIENSVLIDVLKETNQDEKYCKHA